MQNLAIVGEERLKNVLSLDKNNNPDKIKGIVCSEIINILKDYMDINKGSVEFDIAINDKGGYTLKLLVDTKHLHIANHIF